ncbi:hypothetical protein OH76DRAFT_647430 [Lentinus brumalis]|uniref:Uncharacterized protein n=1 Tax=Lentinus brumalis TaxID=2498619 RepID=A0A371D804_9APHY|nr:hypothetical protein OH76DRAFT_647430 [Polyporus brumalis]
MLIWTLLSLQSTYATTVKTLRSAACDAKNEPCWCTVRLGGRGQILCGTSPSSMLQTIPLSALLDCTPIATLSLHLSSLRIDVASRTSSPPGCRRKLRKWALASHGLIHPPRPRTPF